MKSVEEPRLIGGRWEIVRPLAEGGMGSVFVARHQVTQRHAALKVLDAARFDSDEALARFQREARFASDLGHDGVVDVFDAGHDKEHNCLFIAMELLDGRSLREHMDRPEHDPLSTLRHLYQALDALTMAHQKGYVHRDLKPENLFIAIEPDLTESIKVLDFGIARKTQLMGLTQTGTALGTPWYMSPDHALNARDTTAASDVWSLGVMIYEAFAGRVPFEGDTAHAVIVKACTENHVPLDQVASDLPEGLGELVDACLSKEPSGRPADAAALAERLDPIVGAGHGPRKTSLRPSAVQPDRRQPTIAARLSIVDGLHAIPRSFAFALSALGIVATWGGVAALGTVGMQGSRVTVGPSFVGLALAVLGAATMTAYGLWKLQGSRRRLSLIAPSPSVQAHVATSLRAPSAKPPPYRGPAGAPVSVVLFGDFACRECRRLRPRLDDLLKAHATHIKLEWHYCPQPGNFNSVLAAEFAREADVQFGNEAFWLAHDALFRTSGTLKRRKLDRIAEQLRLNRVQLERSLQRDTHKAAIRSGQELASSLGVHTTPGLFVNGVRVTGTPSLERLLCVVQEELVRIGIVRPKQSAVRSVARTPPAVPPSRVATRQILVAYHGARNAPPGMTRSQTQAEERAARILHRIKKSEEDFEVMVLRFSDEPKAAKDRGDLGYLTRDEMDAAVTSAAFALRIGDISEVVHSPAGFHILQRYG